MLDLKKIQKILDSANDMSDLLYCHALGFNANIDDFMADFEDGEIRVDELLRLSIEISKCGYGLANDYRITDEYVLRYFCVTSLFIIYTTLPKEGHTFASMDFLCNLFDSNIEEFQLIAESIESNVFKHYYELLMQYTEYLISPLKNTLEVLLVAYLDKKIADGYVEEMGSIVMEDISRYMENNTYDDLILQIIEDRKLPQKAQID